MHPIGEMFILALVAIVFLGVVASVSMLFNRRHGGNNL